MRLTPSLKRFSARLVLLGAVGLSLAGCVAYAPPPPVYGGVYVAPAPRPWGPPPGYYYGRPYHYWR